MSARERKILYTWIHQLKIPILIYVIEIPTIHPSKPWSMGGQLYLVSMENLLKIYSCCFNVLPTNWFQYWSHANSIFLGLYGFANCHTLPAPPLPLHTPLEVTNQLWLAALRLFPLTTLIYDCFSHKSKTKLDSALLWINQPENDHYVFKRFSIWIHIAPIWKSKVTYPGRQKASNQVQVLQYCKTSVPLTLVH